MFDVCHRKELACLALGLLLFGVLLVPLVHAVHVHGARGSGHSHANPPPHPHPHPHGSDDDSHSGSQDTHEHGAGSLEHPDLLNAALERLAGELEAPAAVAEAVRPLIAVLAVARPYSSAMPQGP